ncbi:hypothetical protein B0T16DRAFT_428330 [Cercophora newfieldiana]|uniref:DUF676 domain-containing protein n=1 Tax=Cercophora newfieldiana TaxID=92897 RepID=A0AA40CUD9_9PEZI|nr:hypothetical protein B0T16DRAFT_428330 [Cercophora newfieldiana]
MADDSSHKHRQKRLRRGSGDEEDLLAGRSSALSESSSSLAEGDPRTFRLRGVPLDWSVDDVRSFLEKNHRSSVPIIRSLAHEIDGQSKTSTITFEGTVSLPTSMWYLPLPKLFETQPAREVPLDDNFYGITTLFAPPLEDHEVDVIAISGLGGHAFGSFKERGRNYMWLRDALPNDLIGDKAHRPAARVMIYGYESTTVGSRNMQNLEDLATSFHSSLLALVDSPSMKPIIFIAHSLGGLIVKQVNKQAIIALSKSQSKSDSQLIQAIYGLIFFGVPNSGMDITSLVPMIGDGPSRPLIDAISSINSQILTMQQREFPSALGGVEDSEMFCFYETLESPTAQNVNGKWSMTGRATILVTKFSATHCRPWESGPEHICAVARTHSDMVKFGPEDHEYSKVRQRIKGLARRASLKMDPLSPDPGQSEMFKDLQGQSEFLGS